MHITEWPCNVKGDMNAVDFIRNTTDDVKDAKEIVLAGKFILNNAVKSNPEEILNIKENDVIELLLKDKGKEYVLKYTII